MFRIQSRVIAKPSDDGRRVSIRACHLSHLIVALRDIALINAKSVDPQALPIATSLSESFQTVVKVGPDQYTLFVDVDFLGGSMLSPFIRECGVLWSL